MARRRTFWWCLVDRHDPGHILYKAPTAQMLADKLGVKRGSILSAVWHFERGDTETCRYRKIKMNDGRGPVANGSGAFYWIEVTRDEQELPVHICNSSQELAKVTGVSQDTIITLVSRGERGTIKNPRFRRVLKV